MYQPFGDEQNGYEELDDEFMETGIHKKKVKKCDEGAILTGSVAKSVYLYQIEAAEEKLELLMDEAKKSYFAVDEQRKQLKQTFLFGYLALAIVFAITCWWVRLMYFKAHFAIGLVVIILSVLFASGIIGALLVKTLRQQINYLVRSKTEVNKYVELFRIKTFQKEEDYYSDVMKEYRKRLERLGRIKKKVNSDVTLTGEEVAFIGDRGITVVTPLSYVYEKVELIKFLQCR